MGNYIHIIVFALTALYAGYRGFVVKPQAAAPAPAACVQAYGEAPCDDNAEK